MHTRTIQQIGPYQTIAPLGKGASGEVWQVTDGRREYALKLYKPGYMQAGGEELEHLRRLNHPNIVQGITTGIWEGSPYLLMEYVSGRPLYAYDPASLSPNQLESIARQLAEAMHHAHQQGIIHRDLKPQNILVTVDFHVKVLDFGVAAPVSDDLNLRIVEGSYRYMAPEQLAGKINFQNDIWAYGVVLFEWLTKEHPYASKDLIELSRQLMLLEVRYLHKIKPGIPPKLSYIVHKCLQKNLASRYPTFGNILEDFREDPTSPLQAQLNQLKKRPDQDADQIIHEIFLDWKHLVTLSVLIAVVAISIAANVYALDSFSRPFGFKPEAWMDFRFVIACFMGLAWLLATSFLVQRFKKRNRYLDFFENLQALAFYATDHVFVKLIEKTGTLFSFNDWRYFQISYLVKRNQYQAAQKVAHILQHKDPDSPIALAFFAVKDIERGNPKNALSYCQRLLWIDPDNSAGLFLDKVIVRQLAQGNNSDGQTLDPTVLRPASDSSHTKRTNGSLFSQKIAQTGSVSIPVVLVTSNFFSLSFSGTLDLYEKYLCLQISTAGNTLRGLDLLYLPRPSRKHNKTVIESAKIKYYLLRGILSFIQNKNQKTPIGWGYEDRAPRFYNRKKGRGFKNPQPETEYIIAYQNIDAIALFGQLWQVHRYGLLGLAFDNEQHQQEFVNWLKDRKIANRKPAEPKHIYPFNPQKVVTLLVASAMIFLSLYCLSILLRYKTSNANSYSFKELMVFYSDPLFLVSAIIGYLILRLFWLKAFRLFENVIRDISYSAYRFIRNLVFPRKDNQWLQVKEQDVYLSCFRLLFKYSQVSFYQEAKENPGLVQNQIEAFPFRFDFQQKRIWVKPKRPYLFQKKQEEMQKTALFDEISDVIFSTHGIELRYMGGTWHQEPLKPKDFEAYTPPLLRAFGSKLRLAHQQILL